MIHLIAWLAAIFGEGRCPACDGFLHSNAANFHVCEDCGAAVDFIHARWSYARGIEFYPLGGKIGYLFGRAA